MSTTSETALETQLALSVHRETVANAHERMTRVVLPAQDGTPCLSTALAGAVLLLLETVAEQAERIEQLEQEIRNDH